MKTLTGKVAIVTGASKGIGAGIATALGAEGASVVVNYASSREGADRVLGRIADAGGNAIAVQASVSEPRDVQRLFAETKKAFGNLDLPVNNAGVFKFEPFEAISIEEFRREFSINVLGPILTIQEAIRQLGFEGGRVINTSSLASSHSLPNGVLYSASKAAVENPTQGLAAKPDREGSASTRSRRATPAAKARRPRAFSVKKASSNTSPLHRSGAWVNLRILPPWPSFSHRTNPRGSPAKPFVSAAAPAEIADEYGRENLLRTSTRLSTRCR